MRFKETLCNCQLWLCLAGFSFGFYSQSEELLILKWNSSISIMGDRCNPSHHRLEKGSTMQKKRGPWDHFAEDNIITLPIEPNIRPSGNQSLWFGDKYLSIVRLFGHDAPKESGALVLRDSSHPPTSPQSPFDRRTVNNSPCAAATRRFQWEHQDCFFHNRVKESETFDFCRRDFSLLD